MCLTPSSPFARWQAHRNGAQKGVASRARGATYTHTHICIYAREYMIELHMGVATPPRRSPDAHSLCTCSRSTARPISRRLNHRIYKINYTIWCVGFIGRFGYRKNDAEMRETYGFVC